jgi:hypothetical protein
MSLQQRRSLLRGQADPAMMLNAAAVALGPIGATYLAAYAPAQASNLASTLLVGGCTRRSARPHTPRIRRWSLATAPETR